MLVSGCDEFVTARGVTTGISTQIYRNATHPEGSRSLARFRMEPFPTWWHETGTFSLERSLCMVRDRSLTIVQYVNRGPSELTLRVRPLLAFRGSHRLQRETGDWSTQTEVRGETSWVKPLSYLPRVNPSARIRLCRFVRSIPSARAIEALASNARSASAAVWA